ncbi:MAG: 4-amino-4-deoxychorismate lyase [Leptolyngbya foveolarum]|uniref:4-amino-4-deoxychorismate lyase n=1 Tax=Leptolyngbya foveolarum TaxID=47253 RepID=A0A2W4U6Z4_9CYAN|nr:MAG: 4-amino-4-deoxychorismate lyase [Leptolyngbya foveolarum]
MSACWYNGKWVEDEAAVGTGVPLDNVGLRFGATVFTTVRVYESDLAHPLTQWQGHCDRLQNSLLQFGWTIPNWGSVRIGAQQLLIKYSVLRITLFPNGCEWITGRDLPSNLTKQQQTGIVAWVAPLTYQRSLPTHKTGNYLACWLAKSQAEASGASEAILIGAEGEWLETSTGNLWGWKDGRWWTPKTERCLPGLMRAWLVACLSAAGESVSVEPWSAKMILGFEAIAYSNCVVRFLPIHTIIAGQTKLNYNAHHECIQALQKRIVAAAGNLAL